jgi:alpha-galactosidase
MVWKCGGINHMAWFTELRWKGRDVYPMLLKAMRSKKNYERDPIRLEMMKEFGYFVTESSGHFSEYVPYFRKRKDLVKKYCRQDFLGGSSFYANCWPGWRKGTDQQRMAMAEGRAEIRLQRGHEYASDIVEGHFFDRRKVIYASVPNTGLIPNLPLTGVVEVAVLVDKRGYMPTYFGNLPEQLAALCRSNMAVFELAVQGILGKDPESIVHAMMLDPLSAAVCSPAEIRRMAGELFRAERKYIPAWVR